MISVMLVDDHDLVRIGIRRLLSDVRGIRVDSEARSGEEALEMVRRKRPDVVLMDVSMPGIGGMEATRKLTKTYPDLKVVVLTVHIDDPFPSRLLQAGAVGYLTKASSVDEMVQAIEDVAAGKRYICPEIAQSLALSMLPGGDDSPFDALSQREMQILLMLTQGEKPKGIAEKLHLSPKTISTYRYRLYEKLGVRNDAEMTRMSIRHGLMDENN